MKNHSKKCDYQGDSIGGTGLHELGNPEVIHLVLAIRGGLGPENLVIPQLRVVDHKGTVVNQEFQGPWGRQWLRYHRLAEAPSKVL